MQKILEFMKIGSKTNFLLNTLLLTEISEWKDKYLQRLISMFKELIDDKYENNRLLLSYNPLMSIALSAELLTKISRERARFQNVCRGLKNELLELGKQYNLKIINEDYFKILITDVDFQNRTILKIITSQDFGALMSEEDPKAENIMKQVYIGTEATKCDGMIYGYSNFMHILTSKAKKPEEKNSFMDIIKIDYEYNYQVDYTFQHRYRSKSIHFFFMKEMFFALCTSVFLIQIYVDYLSKFRGQDIYFRKVMTPIKEGNSTWYNVTWEKCNEQNGICYGSAMYDFESLEVRTDLAQYLDINVRSENVRKSFEEFKQWAPY